MEYASMKTASVCFGSLALLAASLFFATLAIGGKKLVQSTNKKILFCVGLVFVYCW
jgi:hypothetical protein